MATFTIAWGVSDTDPSGQHTVTVTSAAEVDAALDRLRVDGPWPVDVYQDSWHPGEPTPPYGLQLVWGHPERAAAAWLGPHPGYAVDPALSPWPEPVDHDQDAAEPHRTQLTPATARSLVRDHIRTGHRPTGATWITPR